MFYNQRNQLIDNCALDIIYQIINWHVCKYMYLYIDIHIDTSSLSTVYEHSVA